MPNKGTNNFVENGDGSTKYFQRRYFTMNMCIPADNRREEKLYTKGAWKRLQSRCKGQKDWILFFS